jgi:hypothetical protein
MFFHLQVSHILEHVRLDIGPEFIEEKVRYWLAKLELKTDLNKPISPCGNGYISSFNAK